MPAYARLRNAGRYFLWWLRLQPPYLCCVCNLFVLQYLPSALKDGSKRQLDCLGIATAVLALCQQISQQYPQQHADLAASSMVVSDDHCWLSLPSADGNAVLQIEVTDPRCAIRV